jgi:RNA polymerase sigma factor (sigma-70 family)
MTVSMGMATWRPASSRSRLDGPRVERLVRAAAAGQSGAWEGLIDEFGGLVWAVTRSYRLGYADAADVAQTTWLRLLEHLDALNDATRVGAWLATTARRECLRVLREGRRKVFYGDELPEEAASDPEFDTALLAEERDGALWRAFERLRAGDRALLRMLMADPRPAYEEVSAALGLPVGSIGPTRARALDRLRRELAREGSLALLAG